MISHKGMHAYNGNMPIKQPKKGKSRFAKVAVRVKPIPKGKIKYTKNLKIQGIPRRKVSKLAKSGMDRAMKQYIALVTNPIHNTMPVQIPNFDAKPSYAFADYTEKGNGMDLTIAWDDSTVIPLRGVLYVFKYGPTELVYAPDVAYGTACIPIANNGLAIHLGGSPWPMMQPTLHTSIWNLITSLRLVSYGMRVKSNVELVTNTDQQYVARYYTSHIVQGDFETFVGSGNAIPIVDFLAANPVFNTLSNAQGASARWNPCQDIDSLLKYYSLGNLNSTTDTGALPTHGFYYPCIYVEFKSLIEGDPTAVQNEPIHHQEEKLCQRHIDEMQIVKEKNIMQYKMKKFYNDYLNDNKEDSKYDDDFKSVISNTSRRSNLSEITNKINNLNIKDNSKVKNLGVTSVTYSIPLYVEARYWLEGILKEPSPLAGTIVPISKEFYEHYAWLATESNKQTALSKCPLISDGFSFGNIMKFLGRINPKNTRKAFNWAGGMARAMNDGVGDLMGVYSNSLLNSNRGSMPSGGFSGYQTGTNSYNGARNYT